MSEATISVVVPTYNDSPEHLSDCLESIFSQTENPLEIIVVDDGSTMESTVRFLEAVSRRTILIRQENGGVGSARNAGIKRATGSLIQLVDGDDILDPNFLNEVLDAMKDPRVEIAYGSILDFGEYSGLRTPDPEYTLTDLIGSSGFASGSAFRRSSWERVGGFLETLDDGFEDWEFWVRLLRDGGVARRIPTARLHYRHRPGSRTTLTNLQSTREAMIASNPEHHTELLRHALHALDRVSNKLSVRQAELDVWNRRMSPFKSTVDRIRKLVCR